MHTRKAIIANRNRIWEQNNREFLTISVTISFDISTATTVKVKPSQNFGLIKKSVCERMALRHSLCLLMIDNTIFDDATIIGSNISNGDQLNIIVVT